MHQLSIAFVHAAKIPSALRSQELVLVLEQVAGDQRHVLMTEVVQLPDHADDKQPAQLPCLELPSSVSTTFSIPDEIAIDYPPEVCGNVNDPHDNNNDTVPLSLLIALELELFLFVSVPPPSDEGLRTRSRNGMPSSQEKPLLLAQTRWSVPLAQILYVLKTKGILLGTAIGHFGVQVSVASEDRQGFAKRLASFFEHVNPSRLNNVAAIVRDPQVDEVTVFSKLYEKYIRHVPAFSRYGTLTDRVHAMFSLYELGTPRAASALLQQWKGRELELLATLCSEHGPEPWDIPLEARIGALCAAHGITKEEWDPVYIERQRMLREARVACGGAEGRLRDDDANAFEAMLRIVGGEPNPQQYLFPSARIVSNDDLDALYHELLDRRRMALNATSSRTNVEGIRDYIAQQFANDKTFHAYRHLGSEEQSKVALRKLQSTSAPWPLTEAQGDEGARQASASSFVYDPEAQRLLTGGNAPGGPTYDVNRRALTMAEHDRREAAAARCAALLVQTYHLHPTAPSPQPQELQALPAVPSSAPREASILQPDQRSQSLGAKQHQPSSSDGYHMGHNAPSHASSSRASWTVSGDVWHTRPSERYGLPAEGTPHSQASSHVNRMPPMFLFDPSQADTQEDPSGWPEAATRSATMPSHHLDGKQHSIRPMLVDCGTQTNPWGDLPTAQREVFLMGDTQGSRYAWATFIEAAEQNARVPFDRLMYLSEEAFEGLCLELGTPLALRDCIVAERQRLLLMSLRVEYHSDGSDTAGRLYSEVMASTRHSVQRLQIRSVAQAALISHGAHASIFEGHVARHRARMERAEATARMQHSGGDCIQDSKGGLDVSSIWRRVVLVKHTGGTRGVWDWILYGIPAAPVRFYHNFWTGVRDAYRQYVASCAAASSIGAPSAVPLHECAFDILLCTALVGTNVLQMASADCPPELPEEFDSAVIGMGSETEESTVVYDAQHILVSAVLLGCRVDPDMVGCSQHPQTPAVFRRGCASQLVSPAIRTQLCASDLLELQATPPMCVQCLAERALVRRLPPQQQRGVAPPDDRGSSVISAASDASITVQTTFAGTTNVRLTGPLSGWKPGHVAAAEGARTDMPPPPPPGRPREMMDRAWALWRRGSTNACLAALERLAIDFPESSEAAEAQGLLCELVDRHFVNAATHYREACRRNPDSTSCLYRLANVLETRLGNTQEALFYFQRAAELGDAIAQRRALGLELLMDGTSRTTVDDASSTTKERMDAVVPALRPPVAGGALYVPNPNVYTNKHRRAF